MSSIQRDEGAHELRLNLPAAHSAGRMARQMLRQFALREGVPEGEVDTLEFVAGELLDNAVDHGGGKAAMEESDLTEDVRMTLFLGVGQQSWVLRVGDQGGGSPDDVRPLLEPLDGFPDLENERGRGFFLLGQMCDAVRVDEAEDGQGLVIQAEKRYQNGS